MKCTRCQSSNCCHRQAKKKRGFNQYQCQHCGKYFNEKTNSPYNFTQYPIDIIMIAVFFYYRYKLSFVDVIEMMALRGILVSHETIRQWVLRFGTEIGVQYRKRRWSIAGKNGIWISLI